MCAHAVRVAVEKIPGVDSVKVSLNDGYADIALAAQNEVTIEQVRNVIRKNGFSPRETRLRVRGTVARRDSTLLLRLPGGASFRLRGAEQAVQELREMEGSQVTVQGEMPASDSATAAEPALHILQIEAQE